MEISGLCDKCLNAVGPDLARFSEGKEIRKVDEVELSVNKEQKLADKDTMSPTGRVRKTRNSGEELGVVQCYYRKSGVEGVTKRTEKRPNHEGPFMLCSEAQIFPCGGQGSHWKVSV